MSDITLPQESTTSAEQQETTQDSSMNFTESKLQDLTTSNIVLVSDDLEHFYDQAPVSYVGQSEQTQAIQQVASELHVIRICLIIFFIFYVVCKIFYSVKRFFNSLL